jgi:hypothetical protein
MDPDDSDGEDLMDNMFKSSLDVGSYFLKVDPDDSLIFRLK